MEKKTWADLTQMQRRAIIAGGALEAVMTTYAVVDLARRPKSEVRGPKLLWPLAFVVQPVGPLLYLFWGRRG